MDIQAAYRKIGELTLQLDELGAVSTGGLAKVTEQQKLLAERELAVTQWSDRAIKAESELSRSKALVKKHQGAHIEWLTNADPDTIAHVFSRLTPSKLTTLAEAVAQAMDKINAPKDPVSAMEVVAS